MNWQYGKLRLFQFDQLENELFNLWISFMISQPNFSANGQCCQGSTGSLSRHRLFLERQFVARYWGWLLEIYYVQVAEDLVERMCSICRAPAIGDALR